MSLGLSDIVPSSFGLLMGGTGTPAKQNSDRTFVAGDAGKAFWHDSASSHTWTIDTHANAPFSQFQAIAGIVTGAGTLTIVAPSGGSLTRVDGTSGTGNRTVGTAGMFTLINLDGGDAWGISGSALS